MSVVIVDYGMGNLSSVYRALEACGAEVRIAQDSEDLDNATHVILPGVGAFPDGMANLIARDYVQALRKTIERQIPLLGICLGMQLLSDNGSEVKACAGLGFIPGECVKLEGTGGLRIPHVGWNEVESKKDSALFKGIPQNSDFYFVHSYHFVPASDDVIICQTNYGRKFVSGIQKDKIFGVQFHPEKSSKLGMIFLRNFLAIG